jgi:glutamate N-acetyltransferase/amino-acid N-acetyltransferase
MLVASTGVIGRLLPMAVFEAGIPAAGRQLGADPGHFAAAATAVLTTDTRTKTAARQLGPHVVAGFAKGAAMIGPNMATMLGFVLTDAPVPADVLQDVLRRAAADTFNCISVEGHTSTNDTVLILANGRGPALTGDARHQFDAAVAGVCSDLARAIAADAEGANHLVTIDVEGCRTDADAKAIAKTIAESALVKTAIHGADPNWGRIVSAAGYAGVQFDPSKVTLYLNGLLLYERGAPVDFDGDTVAKSIAADRDTSVVLILEEGKAAARFWTTDLTAEYVRLNADYHT